ncbi:MAG: hypothetical protein ABIQ18_39135 [Umezawaea sp.]
MIRRVLLAFIGVAAVVLVPWTAYLAGTLPDNHGTTQWRLAWVGFDVALACCFAVATWLGAHRRRGAVPVLAATAALLCCDAWFDVVLDWTDPDRWTSVALALVVELPLAVLLGLRARHLLTDGMPRRTLALRDVEIHANADNQALLAALDLPTTADVLAANLDRRPDEVTSALRQLATAGYARQDRDGRWRRDRQDLRMPVLADVDEAERPRIAAFLDAKFAHELKLLTWAAEHRADFGPWGKGERATAHLTEAELAGLDAEYHELATRYCLLRTGQAPGTREVAFRFYAFPLPKQEL